MAFIWPSKPAFLPRPIESDWFGSIHTFLGEPLEQRDAFERLVVDIERQVADARARRGWGENAGDTPVAPKRGTDAVADAPAPAKQVVGERKRGWQRTLVKNAARKVWPETDGNVPLGKDPQEARNKVIERLREHLKADDLKDKEISAIIDGISEDTIDRAIGLRKD
jgi:hypothetical protein